MFNLSYYLPLDDCFSIYSLNNINKKILYNNRYIYEKNEDSFNILCIFYFLYFL